MSRAHLFRMRRGGAPFGPVEQALLRGTSSEQGAGLMLKVREDTASSGMTCSAKP